MRIVLISLVAFLALSLLLLGCAFAFQDRLIYYPGRYAFPLGQVLPPHAIEIAYRTSQGEQRQFYLPPKGNRPPRRLWIFFGGNAALALTWLDFVGAHAQAEDGYLLMDYPGYGLCEGRPSPDAILESTNEAVSRVLALRVPGGDADPHEVSAPRLALLGHSLGAAAALDFAARSPHRFAPIHGPDRTNRIDRLVLLSPFTSLRDMGRLHFGFLHVLLRHGFDNEARMRQIRAENPAATISVIHGGQDEIIPVEMGRSLSRVAPGVTFLEIPHARHNDIVERAEAVIVPLLK